MLPHAWELQQEQGVLHQRLPVLTVYAASAARMLLYMPQVLLACLYQEVSSSVLTSKRVEHRQA